MSITRRLFLRQSAAASAVLATVAAPVVADAAQQEHPELLRIRDDLPAAIAEHAAAVRQRDEARTAYDRLAPALPDELIAVDWRNDHFVSERETDCEGKEVWPEPVGNTCKPPRRIYSAHGIALYRLRVPCKVLADRRRWTRLHRVAADHEAACAAASEASGIKPALERMSWAVDDLRRLAGRAADVTPASLTGLVIKAEAIAAYAACGGEASGCSYGYARQLPADVLALFGSGRA